MLRPLDQSFLSDSHGVLPIVRRLFADYGRRYWKRYALAFVFMAVAAGCTALSAYLIGKVVDTAKPGGSFSDILFIALVTVAMFIAKGAATYGHSVILARIGNRIIAENQQRMFDKLLRQNLAFFADRHSSEFMARLNAGAVAASQVLNLLVTAVGRDLLTLLGLVIVMVIQDPLLSLVGLVVVPPALIFLRKLIKRARNVAYSQFVGGARIVETLQEALQGIRTVKAFTLEDQMRARAAADIDAVEQASNKMARVANRSSPLMETLGGIAIAITMLYAGYRVVQGGAAPGEFFSFITAFLLAYEPGKRLARLNIDLNSALIGVRVLFDVIDSQPSEPAEPNKAALNLTAARVELRDVRFAYRAGEPIFRGLSFVAEPGRVTALVGPSGGGKSTVFNLILRLYEADGGAILIDGQDIAIVSRESLRRQTAYVGQDVFMFRGSVRDNIAFGRADADEASIMAAAKAAYAHDFIMSFPNGYDTPVGEHGMALSGGQRQRVAIARALIKDAPIILLDEATAALDSESERQVQDAIARLCEGRTTIVIAHRLSTIMHADRIHVIEAGALVESGRHEELLRKGGRYASFYQLQLKQQAPSSHVTPLAATA
jgi:subfamily B ATP-binding cassette protein MsbA